MAIIMDITGKITGIKYNIFLKENLRNIDIKNFNINECPASCLIEDDNIIFAISKWVSPKRTRSYPYQRVYDTLNFPKKIIVIPIIKDEGFDGDRDFLQWDTVSLMSLLDVFVIFAYYNNAVKNPNYNNKITGFQFDNKYVISKIKEIKQYHSSALHWNLNELKNNLYNIVKKSKKCYENIEKQTKVTLHNQKGIDNFKAKISGDVSTFMEFSREKSKEAQSREIITIQPKENLSTLTKAKITITNYLGGQYFFTIDETLIYNDKISLIECKYSKQNILPSNGDIKDGLLKMILYSNISEVKINNSKIKSEAILDLTSPKIVGKICSNNNNVSTFFEKNRFTVSQQQMIKTLFNEANENNFIIKIGKSK